MEEFASEIVILIITAVIYALTVKRKKNRAKAKPSKRQERAQPSDFKAQMSQLARDLAADGDEPLDKLIRELRTPSGEGQDARPAEGAPAKPAPSERAEKTMFETTVAPEARVRPEPTVKAPADLAAAVRALRAKAPKAEAPQPPKAPQPLETLPVGESVRDAEGCVGGSLGPHREEGESRAEHAAHDRARRAALAAESAAARHAAAVRHANIEQLRRAVVMAEILDKPKALRRR